MAFTEFALMFWEHRNTHFFFGLMVYGPPLFIAVCFIADKFTPQ